ncbi:MAG: tetratricopeptide repeat protein [Marinifilaceae bacterium]|jgi:tetratricopeptide (TPR) repeat protein|nr:tetratricopeptide repeat protein [Marinifilaceae bacterium]
MSKNNKNNQSEDSFENIEVALTKTEQYIEANQKKISIIAISIVAVVAIIFGYNKYIKQPIELKAQKEIFQAQKYFERDSFNLALNGDDNYFGFLDMIEEYGSTKAGNLSKYYAGVSYLKLEKFDDAIKYLSDFSSDDYLVYALSKSALGDAYMGKKEINKAAKYYVEASQINPNKFSTPTFLFKAGLAFEMSKDYTNALKYYEMVNNDYPNSSEGREIEKYITRIKDLK